jgi:CheY-like chemotaxis protein
VTLRVERFTGTDELLSGLGDIIAFTVEDTGIGIPPEKLGTIFEAFEQAHGAGSHKYGGTGLGLSISRELATLLGGRITAVSTPGEGSAFTLYVPVVLPGPETLVPSGAVEQAPPTVSDEDAMHWNEDQRQATMTRLEEWNAERASRMLSGKILIVDDDIRIVIALTRLLGRVGLPVLYALNGREAIETLERDPEISLVLMDIMMPVMDGYEAIRAIRAVPRYSDLPIVVLSAKAIPGEREKALASGANDYLQKPVVDVDRLLKIACDLLDPASTARSSRPEC